MRLFSELDAAEIERLSLLLEELGEAQQAIGKVLRHGYESCHPDGGDSNRESLQNEIGDVCAAVGLMVRAGDLSAESITIADNAKRARVKPCLHHQPKSLL